MEFDRSHCFLEQSLCAFEVTIAESTKQNKKRSDMSNGSGEHSLGVVLITPFRFELDAV